MRAGAGASLTWKRARVRGLRGRGDPGNRRLARAVSDFDQLCRGADAISPASGMTAPRAGAARVRGDRSPVCAGRVHRASPTPRLLRRRLGYDAGRWWWLAVRVRGEETKQSTRSGTECLDTRLGDGIACLRSRADRDVCASAVSGGKLCPSTPAATRERSTPAVAPPPTPAPAPKSAASGPALRGARPRHCRKSSPRRCAPSEGSSKRRERRATNLSGVAEALVEIWRAWTKKPTTRRPPDAHRRRRASR